MKELLDDVIVWEKPDGSLAVTYLIKDAIRIKVSLPPREDGIVKQYMMTREQFEKGVPKSVQSQCVVEPLEDSDQFCNRVLNQIKSDRPELSSSVIHRKKISDLPKTDKRKWRMKNGQIIIDQSVETVEEKREKTNKKVREKLKKLGLEEEEMDLLVRNG